METVGNEMPVLLLTFANPSTVFMLQTVVLGNSEKPDLRQGKIERSGHST